MKCNYAKAARYTQFPLAQVISILLGGVGLGQLTHYWLTNQLSSNIPGASRNIAITEHEHDFKFQIATGTVKQLPGPWLLTFRLHSLLNTSCSSYTQLLPAFLLRLNKRPKKGSFRREHSDADVPVSHKCSFVVCNFNYLRKNVSSGYFPSHFQQPLNQQFQSHHE